jgi:hypothetical protein
VTKEDMETLNARFTNPTAMATLLAPADSTATF